jgi:Flp pilus assembly protein protease CpaA
MAHMTLPARFRIEELGHRQVANDVARTRLFRAAVATVVALHVAGWLFQILGGGDAGILVTEMLGSGGDGAVKLPVTGE